MATIEYFRIEIRPWKYANTQERVFEIMVQVNSERYHLKQIVGQDDLHSMLDVLFDEAKAKLAEAISDQQEPAQAQ